MDNTGQDVQDQNLVNDQAMQDMSQPVADPNDGMAPQPQIVQPTAPAMPEPAAPTQSVAEPGQLSQPSTQVDEPVVPAPETIESTPEVAPAETTEETTTEEAPAEQATGEPVVPAPEETEEVATPEETEEEVEEMSAPTPAPEAETEGHDEDLLELKQQALTELKPLIDHLDLPPDEKFETILHVIRASDDKSLLKPAFDAAEEIEDDTKKATALKNLVDEIDYLNQINQNDQETA